MLDGSCNRQVEGVLDALSPDHLGRTIHDRHAAAAGIHAGADGHDARAAWMIQTDPTHDAIVPYADLSSEVAGDDLPYVQAIRAVAEEIS